LEIFGYRIGYKYPLIYILPVSGTDCAQCCLTSVMEGTGAFNIAYGRWQTDSTLIGVFLQLVNYANQIYISAYINGRPWVLK
jgi:hypothetical protein